MSKASPKPNLRVVERPSYTVPAEKRFPHPITYALLFLLGSSSLIIQSTVFNQKILNMAKGIEGRFNRLDGHLSFVSSPPGCPNTDQELAYYKILSMKKTMSRRLAREISSSVVRYSKIYEKDPNLVLSVIAAESDFNPKAVSSTGALGLMQVMPFWKKELGIPCDLKSVDCNIRYGVHILKTYGSRYEDLEYTLAAYNRGPLAVLRDVESGNTVGDSYTKRVLGFKSKLERME